MNDASIRLLLSLIAPSVLMIFTAAFIGAWLKDRERHYLLLMAAGCLLAPIGAIMQILQWPSGDGRNALFSNFFYTSAILCAVEGILLRARRPIGFKRDILLLTAFMALIAYYFYVDRDVLMRVYIQNAGYGALFITAALRMRKHLEQRTINRALFCFVLLFGLQFIVRTVLTIGLNPPHGVPAFGRSEFWQYLMLTNGILGPALALTVLAAAISDIISDIQNERDIDPLTGILNRTGFERRSSKLFLSEDRRASKANKALSATAPTSDIAVDGEAKTTGRFPWTYSSLIVCDLDHFKKINDTYGHLAGDEVLATIGETLKQHTRKQDIVGRIGGEEFVIILPGVTMEAARLFAERLRLAVAACRFSFAQQDFHVTCSIGLTTFTENSNFLNTFAFTDELLYEAKASGRNKIIARTARS